MYRYINIFFLTFSLSPPLHLPPTNTHSHSRSHCNSHTSSPSFSPLSLFLSSYHQTTLATPRLSKALSRLGKVQLPHLTPSPFITSPLPSRPPLAHVSVASGRARYSWPKAPSTSQPQLLCAAQDGVLECDRERRPVREQMIPSFFVFFFFAHPVKHMCREEGGKGGRATAGVIHSGVFFSGICVMSFYYLMYQCSFPFHSTAENIPVFHCPVARNPSLLV